MVKPAFPFCFPGQSQYTSSRPLVAVVVGLSHVDHLRASDYVQIPLLCSENENWNLDYPVGADVGLLTGAEQAS
jgi:hypothetical protein